VDLQEQIKKLLNRIGEDDSLRSLFQKDPVAAAEKVLGIDLPDDLMEKIIDGVKAKLSLEQAAGLFSAAKGSVPNSV